MVHICHVLYHTVRRDLFSSTYDLQSQNMRVFILPFVFLLAQYTITALAAPVTPTVEDFRQILSDLALPQEEQKATARGATLKQFAPLGIGQVLTELLNPSKVTSAMKTTNHAPTIKISSTKTSINQLQITRALPLGRRFQSASGPARRAATKYVRTKVLRECSISLTPAHRRSQPRYHIPDTSITLIFRFGPPMRPDAMARALLSTAVFVQFVLNDGGDGPLSERPRPIRE